MASHGFIVNDAEVANITNTFVSALLHEDEAMDAKSIHGALPGSSYLSNLGFSVDVTAGAVTEVEWFLTWDSAGDSLITPIHSATGDDLVAGRTDVSLLNGAGFIDLYVRAPATQTTYGKVYLWIRAAAGGGTMTLKRARLFWTVLSSST